MNGQEKMYAVKERTLNDISNLVEHSTMLGSAVCALTMVLEVIDLYDATDDDETRAEMLGKISTGYVTGGINVAIRALGDEICVKMEAVEEILSARSS